MSQTTLHSRLSGAGRPVLVSAAIVLSCVAVVATIEYATTPAPRDRHIHLEVFRYGIHPSVIRVNRGDRLTLTFSSRDTAHSFMLQDYRIDAKISPERGDYVLVYDPLQATEPPKTVQQVELTAGLPGVLGRLVTVSRHRCHVYCGPMHGFEQGDLIVRPNWLFAVSVGLLLSIPLVGVYRVRVGLPRCTPDERSSNLFDRFPLLKKPFKWRGLQFAVTLPVLAFFVVVILAGLLGTKVGGRNLAVMATWVIWMSVMAIVLMPLNSRLWCMICPLPVIGEYLQRGLTLEARPAADAQVGNTSFGLRLRWPRFLRGAWLRQLVFLCIGTLAASFAGMPRWTAMLLLGLFTAATIMSLIWEKRAFCQYLCPVTSFLGVYSGAGRLMVRVADSKTCWSCANKDCYKGNAKGWACPFNVYVGSLKDNAECGFCTECFKSCPYDNVVLALRRGPMRERFRTTGQAWQALAMLSLAMAYSLIILSPWPGLRDVVNVVDRGRWPRFLVYVLVLWSLTLTVIPGIYWMLNRWGLSRAGLDLTSREAFRRFAPTFVPLGLGLWVAFFLTMFMVNFVFVLMTLSDPFGWGWNLLGTSGMPWVQLWPGAIPWLQSGLVLAGLALSLRHGYRLWLSQTGVPALALQGFAPTAGFLLTLAGGMIVYFTQF